MENSSPYDLSNQVLSPLGWLPRAVAVRQRTRHANRNSNGIRPQGDTDNNDGVSNAIPAFNPSLSVTASNARIDRVRLTNNLGIAHTDHVDDYTNFRNALKLVDKKVFLTPPDTGTGIRPIDIRASETVQDGQILTRPLFNGNLKTICKNTILLLSNHIYLNPTRAVRFYPEMSGQNEGVFETIAKPTEPRTLDRKSNCLPAWITQEDYLRSERRHFENVFQELERSCIGGAEMATLPSVSFQASDFCVKDCEVYYEFYQPDAVEALRSLQEHLYRYGEEVAIREHAPRTEAYDTETSENGESVKVRLSKTEHLIVYAKTANRLRFEVRFLKPSSNIVARRSAANLDGLFDIFDLLRTRAASRVTAALEYLSECLSSPSTTVASDWRYKQAWYAVTGWSAISDGFLDTLRLKGRLFVRQATDAEKSVIRKAKRAGLIRYMRDRRTYVPVAEAIE